MKEKNVFLVHSYITIYLARYYIQKNNLQPSDVVILYDRVKIHELVELPGKKLKFIPTFGERFTNRKTFWNTYKKVKQFFSGEVGGPFNLIVLNLSYDPAQLLASHSQCKKIVYLEEGDQTYSTEQELKNIYRSSFTFSSRGLRKLYSLGKLYMKYPFPETGKPEEALCVHEDAFGFKKIRKTVVDIREVFTDQGFNFSEDYTDGAIFLVEHFMSFSDAQKEVLYGRLKKVFGYVKSNFADTVFLKPHPALKNQEALEKYITLAEEAGLQTRIIKDPVELILVNFSNVRLFSNHSSLLRYCSYARLKPYVWGFERDKERNSVAAGQLDRFNFLRSNQEKVEFLF